jgi:hypothetical protein
MFYAYPKDQLAYDMSERRIRMFLFAYCGSHRLSDYVIDLEQMEVELDGELFAQFTWGPLDRMGLANVPHFCFYGDLQKQFQQEQNDKYETAVYQAYLSEDAPSDLTNINRDIAKAFLAKVTARCGGNKNDYDVILEEDPYGGFYLGYAYRGGETKEPWIYYAACKNWVWDSQIGDWILSNQSW